MKKTLATIGLLATLLPSTGFAFTLQGYEDQTKVAARFTSGALDQRLIDLGSNYQTKEFFPIMARTIKKGVEQYCASLFRALGTSTAKCARQITHDGVTF